MLSAIALSLSLLAATSSDRNPSPTFRALDLRDSTSFRSWTQVDSASGKLYSYYEFFETHYRVLDTEVKGRERIVVRDRVHHWYFTYPADAVAPDHEISVWNLVDGAAGGPLWSLRTGEETAEIWEPEPSVWFFRTNGWEGCGGAGKEIVRDLVTGDVLTESMPPAVWLYDRRSNQYRAVSFGFVTPWPVRDPGEKTLGRIEYLSRPSKTTLDLLAPSDWDCQCQELRIEPRRPGSGNQASSEGDSGGPRRTESDTGETAGADVADARNPWLAVRRGQTASAFTGRVVALDLDRLVPEVGTNRFGTTPLTIRIPLEGDQLLPERAELSPGLRLVAHR